MSVLDRLRKAAAPAESLTQQLESIQGDWDEQYNHGNNAYTWCTEVYDDHVIVRAGDDYYSVTYTRTGGTSGDECVFDVANATPVQRTWVEVAQRDTRFEITKVDDAQQLVFGWANVAVDKAGNHIEDLQGDLITEAELENAAYAFTLNYREGDDMHTDEVQAHLVESMVFTPEKLEKMGLAPDALPTAWWVGFHVDNPELFAKVRSGERRMFSIGGMGYREQFEEASA